LNPLPGVGVRTNAKNFNLKRGGKAVNATIHRDAKRLAGGAERIIL
jgi:hypothetical protein